MCESKPELWWVEQNVEDPFPPAIEAINADGSREVWRWDSKFEPFLHGFLNSKGERTGRWTGFHSSGQIYWVQDFKRGVEQRPWRCFDLDGREGACAKQGEGLLHEVW